MPQRKIPNVTQQQIEQAQLKAIELYQRSSNMTRNDFNHLVAADILDSTEATIRNKMEYCRETGDDIRADAMDHYLKAEQYRLERGRNSQWLA